MGKIEERDHGGTGGILDHGNMAGDRSAEGYRRTKRRQPAVAIEPQGRGQSVGQQAKSARRHIEPGGSGEPGARHGLDERQGAGMGTGNLQHGHALDEAAADAAAGLGYPEQRQPGCVERLPERVLPAIAAGRMEPAGIAEVGKDARSGIGNEESAAMASASPESGRTASVDRGDPFGKVLGRAQASLYGKLVIEHGLDAVGKA